jgi:hypothetical protein
MEMDQKCDLASSITAYIVQYHTDYPLTELEETQDNGDIRYSDRVQDIFNEVLDLIDEEVELV